MESIDKANLFIVGAAKSGTTAIHNYLNKHSSVFLSPIKEVNYFCTDINLGDFRKSYKRKSTNNKERPTKNQRRDATNNCSIY